MSLSYMNMLLFKSMHGRPLFKRKKACKNLKSTDENVFGFNPLMVTFLKSYT